MFTIFNNLLTKIFHAVVTKERFLKVHQETARLLKLGKALPSLRPLTTIRALFWMRKALVVTADFDRIPQICSYKINKAGVEVTTIHHLE